MSTAWIDAGALDSLPETDPVGLLLQGHDIAVYRIGQDVYATDNSCTHGYAELCNGFLDGFEIECPMHQGRFDVRTGKALCAPATQDLRCYPVRIEANRVYVGIAETDDRSIPTTTKRGS